jgi:energy-coupling factor transporter ATP-binding protein EcfA2
MFKVIVKNFRRIRSAEIFIDKITLICAKNGNGKTSLLQALSAAFTNNSIPVPGVTKKNSQVLVHSGTAQGSVTLEKEDGSKLSIDYPLCTKTTNAVFKEISGISAGTEDLIRMSKEDRTQLLKKILKADPEFEDFEKECSNIGLSKEHINAAWKTISAQGFDAAYSGAMEKGARLKGQWEQITGERYGAKKATSWSPAGYDASVMVSDLELELKSEKEWLEAAVVHNAVEDIEIAKLKEDIAKIPDLKTRIDSLETDLINESKFVADLNDKLSKIPNLNEKGQECPHCKGLIFIRNGKLSNVGLNDNEKKQFEKELKSLQTQHQEHSNKYRDLVNQQTKIAGELYLAQVSEQKLSELTDQKEGNASSDQVNECRLRVQAIEKKLEAVKLKNEASAINAKIEINKKMCDILSPDGLRQTKITNSLSDINKTLDSLCKIAKWDTIEITKSMDIECGGTPYYLLSESFQFRTKVIIQAAVSMILKDDIIFIDRADMLDGDGRNGLLKMLDTLNKQFGLKSVYAMTFTKKEQLPNFSKFGMVYWVENGIAEMV